jgi:uncharacterized protein YkwD
VGRLLRGALLPLALAATVAACWQGSAAASPWAVESGAARISAADGLERPLLELVNQARRQAGLDPLRPSATLARAANGHGRAMARHGFFSHDSRDGSSFRDRLTRLDRSLRDGVVGEVLLWRSPAPTPAEALAMWLASPPHRAVLLDGRYRTIGIAAVSATGAPGVFRGLDVTIVAADLAG